MTKLLLPAALLLLAACGKPEAPPAAPTPQAIGAELAKFPQLLVPISTSTWSSMTAAAKEGVGRVRADEYPRPYARPTVLVDGKETPVLVAYTGVWLAPSPIPLQPMSVQQFLRLFAADEEAKLASVIAPKGSIFFTREQVVDVLVAARAAGADSSALPYSLVHGIAREPR